MATSNPGALAAPLPTALQATNPSRWAALPVLLAGAFMVVLDFFIVNVALPSIATDLGRARAARVGRRRLRTHVRGLPDHRRAARRRARPPAHVTRSGRPLHGDLAACGLAPSPTALVIARLAQGARRRARDAAGAVDHRRRLPRRGLRAGARDLRRGARPRRGRRAGDRRRAGRGGRLGLGWRGCFLIDVPVGIAALALTPRRCRSRGAERPEGLDLVAGAR